jgi:MoaA/NifB/PqqE/SkfB family radical SAM enzyme
VNLNFLQHFRRVLFQQWKRRPGLPKPPVLPVNDGNGFVFVSHSGDIQPSGFLPITAGNVRREELLEVYRNSPLFRELRDPDLLEGKCGSCGFRTIWSRRDDPLLNGLRSADRPLGGRCAGCRFRDICGGGFRVRAWQRYGDPWAEDPGCHLTGEGITAHAMTA